MPSKQEVKQLVRRVVGEPYVGKRLKMRALGRELRALDLDPRSIIDVGSEDATFSYWLAERFSAATVTGVDMDAAAIEACAAALPAAYRQRVSFRVTDVADLPSEAWDLATAFDVFEHVEDDMSFARAIFERLRPGGHLLVHVPERRWIDWRGREHRGLDEDAWKVNAGHVRQGYDPEGMRSLLTGAGFEVVKSERWTRRWGAVASAFYGKVEHPAVLRLLSLPVTDLCAALDQQRPESEGNTLFVLARRPTCDQQAPHQ